MGLHEGGGEEGVGGWGGGGRARGSEPQGASALPRTPDARSPHLPPPSPGAFTLVFREDTVDEAAVQRQMMGGGGGAPGAGPPDMAKAFEAERAALGLAAVVPRTAVAEAAAREAMAGVLAQPPVVRR